MVLEASSVRTRVYIAPRSSARRMRPLEQFHRSRGESSRFVARRDAQSVRERERELICAPPMYVCASKSQTRRSWPSCTCSLVVARGRGRLSLSLLSRGLYPSFPVLVRRWARICEVLRGCRPPSYRASHHSGWVTPVGTRCGICARCRRSPSLRRAASNRPQPHQRTSRWARRTGSTRVARPPRARA